MIVSPYACSSILVWILFHDQLLYSSSVIAYYYSQFFTFCVCSTLYCVIGSTVQERKPSLHEVFELLKDQSSEWDSIGRALGVSLNY